MQEVALIKGADKYTWYSYKGKKLNLVSGNRKETLVPGAKIGFRKSSDGKKIRMVFADQVSRVFTVDAKSYATLVKNSRATRL